jgi:hypothetical protein
MAPTLFGRSRALRIVIYCWIAITVVTVPFSYGLALIFTLPVLACLIAAAQWIQPTGIDVFYLVLTMLAISGCVAWFLGRADERPLEGVAAGFFILCGVAELFVLRSGRTERMNQR